MEIRHLQYVLELARHRSFTKAAEALHITQPTLSKAIKNLEEELGVELFARIGKRVELTEAGKVIWNQGQNILHSFHNLTTELSDLTNLNKGTIRIGLPPMVGSSFFPGVMSRFRERYPGLAIHLVEEGSKKLEKAVAEGELDMAVVLLPTNEDVFETYSIVQEELRVIVPVNHPLAARRQVALKELAAEPFILFREDFALHGILIEKCNRAGFQPEVLYQSSQWDFIREMAAAGLGLALLPETICRSLDLARARPLRLVDPVIPWHLAMIWRKNSYLSIAAREWIRFTQSLFPDKARTEGKKSRAQRE